MFKITSGIAGQHNDGGTSAGRLQRKRQEEVNAFLRKICKKAQELKVDGWTYEGDKGAIKKGCRKDQQTYPDLLGPNGDPP